MKIPFVAGARSNFVKIAPLIYEFKKESSGIEWRIPSSVQRAMEYLKGTKNSKTAHQKKEKYQNSGTERRPRE